MGTVYRDRSGWLYLAAVMDLYSRRIVGWAMADHLRADLPLATLRMAISAHAARCRPDPPFRSSSEQRR